MKVLQEVRLDYQSTLTCSVSIAASRDLGYTFDPPFAVNLPAAPNEQNAVGYCYSVSQYPTFKVETSSNALRIFRFQTQQTVGGSSA